MKQDFIHNWRDPLTSLSPELFDLIFQHLKPKDLMRKSFVSKLWHEEIGNSKTMKKVNIFIYNTTQKGLNESFETLLRSQRDYKNVSVNLGTFTFDNSLESVAKVGQIGYKKVKYSDGNMCLSLWPIESIESTVETLILSFIRCDFECDSECRKFPNLRHLTLYQNSPKINLLFKNCSQLCIFDYSEQQGVNESKLIEKILMNNSSLVTLSLQVECASKGVKAIFPYCKFRLKKFTFHSFKLNNPMSTANIELLCDILRAQCKYIEELSLNQWCGSNALELIFQIRKLRNLTLNINYGSDNLSNISLKTNLSVSRVDIDDMKENDTYILYKIFKSLPNLVIYKTCLMQNHDMIMLERHCKHLQELYVENFSVNYLPNSNLFSNVSHFKSLDIDNEIVMTILGKEDSKRSHFERLVLAAATWICIHMS